MKQIKGFLQSNIYDIYMLLLIGFTYLKYTNQVGNIYFILMALIALTFIIIKRNVFYLLPIPLAMQMSFGDMRDNKDITIIFGSVIIILLIIDVVKNRKMKHIGYLTIPLSLLLIASTLTMFNGFSAYSNMVSWFQIFSVITLYIYFLNTIDKKIPYEILCKMIMYLAVLVTAEMLHFVLHSELEIIEVIAKRKIDLGWENLNIIIYVNLISIPLIGYLITTSKFKIYYMTIASFIVVGILLTLSRSSILSLGVYVLVLVPMIMYFEKNRLQLLLHSIGFAVVLLVALKLLENQDIVTGYMDTLLDRELTKFTDRLILLEIARDSFLKHPIFGEGGVFASRYIIADNGNTAINYHNTIAQTMTLGITGLLAFVFLFFRKFRLILQSMDSFKWFALVMLTVTALINGMLQPMYYYTSYMMYLFLVLAFIEVKKEQKDN